ncbi:MAG: 7-cyano-7-deazaguanine synthase QueC [Methylohalobius crimeensis]
MTIQSKKAVVLLSGGLDSMTTLLIARQQGYACHCLSFDYGQRQGAELAAAKTIARTYGAREHRIIRIGLEDIGGSALTDRTIDVPESPTEGIPVTYVPARNTVFLAFALGYAEVMEAFDIFIGVNAVDYSGYPDCRPEYIEAFQHLADLATKAGVEGGHFRIHTPLICLPKSDIIRTGIELGADYSLAVSCYAADERGRACGKCDACRLRREGFAAAGVPDPTFYRAE